jgi:valyl-tRNA synthetase
MVVATAPPTACPACSSNDLTQDTDVLDTWFSSALWPFSTMGWPEKTDLLKTFYPTSCLVTGFDILFFWVARMMMMGIHFMDEVPFKDVYVHALVRDEDGKKMSKSKGNVIDPLVVIEKYGTDAFRFTLTAFAVMGRDVKMSERRVEGYRHFVNKLWNAARFTLMHVTEAGGPIDRDQLELPDRWILSRLSQVTDTVTSALEAYKFNEAAATLYNFIWHEFCDWYLEAIKPVLYDENSVQRAHTLNVLWRVLKDTLVLLHPIMPFVTEEIWSKLPGAEGSIMNADFPVNGNGVDRDIAAEDEMKLVIGVITGVRNIRGEMNLTPNLKLDVQVQTADDNQRQWLDTGTDLICNLAKIDNLSITGPGDKPKTSAAVIVDGVSVLVNLEGIIDFAKESARLEKEINKLSKEISGMEKKLANEGFLSKAPAAVVAGVREKHEALTEKRNKQQGSLDLIREMSN